MLVVGRHPELLVLCAAPTVSNKSERDDSSSVSNLRVLKHLKATHVATYTRLLALLVRLSNMATPSRIALDFAVSFNFYCLGRVTTRTLPSNLHNIGEILQQLETNYACFFLVTSSNSMTVQHRRYLTEVFVLGVYKQERQLCKCSQP